MMMPSVLILSLPACSTAAAEGSADMGHTDMNNVWKAAGLAALVTMMVASPARAGNGGGDNSDHENPVEEPTFHLDRLYTSQNGITKQSTVTIGDGSQLVTVVYDAPTDRVYVSNAHGAAEAPLQQVAMAFAGNNVQSANAFADSVRMAASRPGGWERIIGPAQWSPPSASGGPCDLSPCGADYFRPDYQIGDLSRQMGIRGFDYHDDWYSLTYDPTTIAQDKHYFEVWRRGECDAANDDDVDGLYAVGGVVATCPLAETGLGAVGCGLAVGQLLRSGGADHDQRHRNCNQSYPGPTRWGN